MKALFLLGLLCVCFGQIYSDCYANNDNPYLFFATKTSYKFIKNTNIDPITVAGCAPAQMWLFARHGTRYPRNDPPLELELDAMLTQLPLMRKAIIDNHDAGRGLLCNTDLDNLDSWTITIDPADEEKLAPAGEEELMDLGDRYKARLPDLLDHSYQESRYKFRFTTASRTEKSCKRFAEGVFGNDQENTINYPEPTEEDPLLRFYQLCTKWINEVDNNTDSRIEKTKFTQGPEVAETLRAVSERLGYQYTLALSEVQLMYSMCRYDKALSYKSLSPWCAAFSESDLRVLEYIEDLDYYYKDGYGYQINWEQACNPIVDLFQHINIIVSGQSDEPYGIFYFSHSGALAKLLARLGLFKDAEPLRADNFLWQQARQWSTSRILPFASNLAFVLFKCDLGTYRVLTLLNERPVKIPGCTDEACLLSEFAAIFQPIASSCDLNAICEIVKS